MGYKRDQHYDAETFRQSDTEYEAESGLPPPYIEEEQTKSSTLGTASALSLPQDVVAALPGKRKLLLVYIHGFTGNEMSFQAFPTHVHELISNRLAETYRVQSIIYPKYKSRKKIDFARDDMGGLLAAEVALLPLASHSATPLRHHILGTVNLDVPFLGVHPGIVTSGISSLFRKAPNQPSESATEQLITPSSSVDLPEPFPPPSQPEDTSASTVPQCSSSLLPTSSSMSLHANDTGSGLADSTGLKQSKVSRAIYFINKHSDGLTKATKSYLTSHVEFGSCLADYKGLVGRYSHIRAHEDNPRSRVRFVNYYTASTGRPKKQKLPRPVENGAEPMSSSNSSTSLDGELRDLNISTSNTELQDSGPRASITAEKDYLFDPSVLPSQETSDAASSRVSEERILETSCQSLGGSCNPPNRNPPDMPSSTAVSAINPDSQQPSTMPSTDSLPPLPDPPSKPPPLDSTSYTDKYALKIASRDHDRAMKTYSRLLKDRDNAIKDRRKLLAKRAKATAKEDQKTAKGKGKVDEKADSPDADNSGTSDPTPAPDFHPSPTTHVSPPSSPAPVKTNHSGNTAPKSPNPDTRSKPPKYHPFCLLPHQHDLTWIRVIMRDVDEIDAHCGLFVREGEHYAGFVAEVVERIVGWVEK
ncbi:MAG: hypothetical protein Q9182_001088 [Xanthomendoza sp. 2 TL-2023]